MTPGFAHSGRDSQACFRAVLDAISRPGTLHVLTGTTVDAPGLDPATAAVLLTLCDPETPVCLQLGSAVTAAWLAFHAGCPAAPLSGAQFVATAALDWPAYDTGTDDEPERGATVILQLPALGTGTPYTLSGPGIEQTATLAATGLPPNFAAAWARNHAQFPRGLDLILCAGRTLAALPRSVWVS